MEWNDEGVAKKDVPGTGKEKKEGEYFKNTKPPRFITRYMACHSLVINGFRAVNLMMFFEQILTIDRQIHDGGGGRKIIGSLFLVVDRGISHSSRDVPKKSLCLSSFSLQVFNLIH